ncbi:lipopolysaccharide core biosynthesis protein [Escherichia coli]|uniref:Lipopolysaccharide core biosynthesis protein n=1 Tax=Escherichia coli TaxID=562 RepID=A0A2X1NBG7_ECOLX|nr:lipopolysaccharide core biosynthesis protein [Escherichia coli]
MPYINMAWFLATPHRGNFIIKNGEVRIIDLSGKRASAQRKAKDRIDLERHYGIKNEIRDLGYYLLVYRKKMRNFMRRLKGKPGALKKIPQLHVFTRTVLSGVIYFTGLS